MSIGFRGHDMVETAVQMERNGLRFYRQAADGVADGLARDLLQRLADDEVRHLRFFETMLASVGLAELHESHPGEYEKYLRAHVDGQVFTAARMEKLLAEPTMSEVEALQFGIDAEKDAILYYTEMNRFVPSRDHTMIEGILDEERRHLAQLTELLKRRRG